MCLCSCGFDNRAATPKEFYYAIQGTWRGACTQMNGYYRIQSMQFSDYYVRFKEEVFSDTACQVPSVTYDLKANFALGANMDVIIPGSIEFMTRVLEVQATAVDAATVASYNFNSTCGYSNWTINVPQNVSGRTCEVGDKQQPTVGYQYINLIGLEPKTTLHIGNDRCELTDDCVTYLGAKYPREYYPWTLQKVP